MKFEYKVLKSIKDYSVEEELNKYGEEGWDCFNMVKSAGGFTLYLKRVFDKKINENYLTRD